MTAAAASVRPMEEIPILAIPPEIEAKLRAPLPPHAITQHPTKSYLSSIKPAFIIERMNEAFGAGSYHETYREISINSKTQQRQKGEVTIFVATVHGTLEIPKYGIHLENFGGSENDDAGDALKGAATDAFTKMCSHLGIGLEVYKGRAPQQAKPPAAASAARPAIPADKITIHAQITDIRQEKETLWIQVGQRLCASKQEDIKRRFLGKKGWYAELLVSPVQSTKGPAFQIHKVISVLSEREAVGHETV